MSTNSFYYKRDNMAIPGNRWHIWHTNFWRDKSSSFCNSFLSFSIWRDVWRYWSWRLIICFFNNFMFILWPNKVVSQYGNIHSDKIPLAPNGSICFLHGFDIQWFYEFTSKSISTRMLLKIGKIFCEDRWKLYVFFWVWSNVDEVKFGRCLL
jgi:hypothetical protein